uniref:Uncharacterized protein n=1 Tax=viral metagenome TaxID=1070528 RepID=A0A6C0L3V5_9ZZZZ|tara:strand:- start:4589 stop:5101 length:513 start_codon:yes stop_codon:yes gene_type:complete
MEDSMFNNSSYQLDRLDRQTIILDIEKADGAGVDKINFSVELMEALNIDKKYNLFLDSISTLNCVDNDTSTDTMGFLLSINNFNILSSSNQQMSRKLFIPNEQSGGTGASNTKTHKGKKMNYICKVEPTRIQTISGSITLLDGLTDIFKGTAVGTTAGRIIIELILIKAE